MITLDDARAKAHEARDKAYQAEAIEAWNEAEKAYDKAIDKACAEAINPQQKD